MRIRWSTGYRRCPRSILDSRAAIIFKPEPAVGVSVLLHNAKVGWCARILMLKEKKRTNETTSSEKIWFYFSSRPVFARFFFVVNVVLNQLVYADVALLPESCTGIPDSFFPLLSAATLNNNNRKKNRLSREILRASRKELASKADICLPGYIELLGDYKLAYIIGNFIHGIRNVCCKKKSSWERSGSLTHGHRLTETLVGFTRLRKTSSPSAGRNGWDKGSFFVIIFFIESLARGDISSFPV